jgi:hypothetical protein
VDLERGLVTVSKNWVELLESGVKYEKEPKSEAGKRTVNIPPHVLPVLRVHAEQFAGPEFFCVGKDGKRMRGNAIYQAFVRARKRVGLDISFHDYADVCVMPMFPGTSCSPGVAAWKLSA